MALLKRVLRCELCPKALLCNISEFVPIRELFQFAKERRWSARECAATYLVARGIRGREGVRFLVNFCKQKLIPPKWEDTEFTCAFIEAFDEAWRGEVLRTGKVSAFSHQEHHHAGLSGMNFVDGLRSATTRVVLFGPFGIADRLQRFFDGREVLSAEVLLDFYTELVRHPMPLHGGTRYVQTEGARILGKRRKRGKEGARKASTVSDGSYNSMDFLRCFSNIMTDVYYSPEVYFTEALWTKMLQCQARPRETAELLSLFRIDMGGANSLIAGVPGMNWTTFLVCICEVRQAIGHSVSSFTWMLEKLEARPDLIPIVADVAQFVVDEGASPADCYCVRVCHRVHLWLDDIGREDAPLIID